MTTIEIVEEFIRLTTRCLDVVKAGYEGTDRPSVRSGLLLRPRDGGDPIRSGDLNGVGKFILHGRGCLFELDTGEDLDIDWDDQGRVIFDSWRARKFAQSIERETFDREVLRIALIEIPSTIQVSTDEFTWVHRGYDIIRGV